MVSHNSQLWRWGITMWAKSWIAGSLHIFANWGTSQVGICFRYLQMDCEDASASSFFYFTHWDLSGNYLLPATPGQGGKDPDLAAVRRMFVQLGKAEKLRGRGVRMCLCPGWTYVICISYIWYDEFYVLWSYTHAASHVYIYIYLFQNIRQYIYIYIYVYIYIHITKASSSELSWSSRLPILSLLILYQ